MPKRSAELKGSQLAKLGEGVHGVGGCDGLALQVRGANRSWILRVTAPDGRRLTLGVGSAADYSLSEARERGLALRKRVRDEGFHPIRARQQARATAIAAAVSAVTFKKAAEAYISDNAAGWKNVKHAAQWTSTLTTYAFPTLGQLPVGDIQAAHVVEVLRPIWTTKPETASRVRQRIELVIAAADAQAGRQRLNPARLKGNIDAMLPSMKRVKKVEHHTALDWRQLPGFMKDLAGREGIAARALAWAIHTAARSGEVRGMTWGELDLEAGVWTIPAERMKAGREHVIPLTDAAIACLPAVGQPGEIVFPGLRGKPLSDMTLAAVLKRMGVDATVHGFRSSFRDWAGEATAHPREVIEMALAHQLGDKAEAAYARGDLRQKRRALMADWSTYATSKIGRPDEKVVALAAHRG